MKPNELGIMPVAPEEEVEALLVPEDQPAIPDEVIENPDGSVTFVELEPDRKEQRGFHDNLADGLPRHQLHQLGGALCELIDIDKQARELRDKQYAEGIQRTGLGKDAPGGAMFDGASKAVHPMLAKGCVDFASKASKELLPANGPCKSQIIGEATEEKITRADRKRRYMNWQMTTQVRENAAELEKLLSQVPLGGSQYKRWWWDAQLGRPRTEAVYIDDVLIPYDQNDFYTSPRITHVQRIGRSEFESRVASGLYLDLDNSAPSMAELTASEKATDKVQGAEEPTNYDEAGLRTVYLVYLNRDLSEEIDDADEGAAPYIVHIDQTTECVLGVYRNWDQKDELKRPLTWMVEYPFIPWRGAYSIGLLHLIGSLAGSATGALRALLDSAHISNFPGGLKLAGGRTAGETLQIAPTELKEIEAPPNVDDIRKLIMGFPFNGPSNVLFQLLEWLTQQGEMVVSTASEKIADAGANMPMGTAMALIEGGSVNFSAIHARMHRALKEELRILHRLNRDNLKDEEVVEELGELVVSRGDFDGPMDIIPVSDPNIFSEAQRFAQLQAVLQLKADPQFAPFFKPEKLLARALRLLQLPDAEEVTNLPKDSQRADPLQENEWAAKNERPLKVYDEQDDAAHLIVHLAFAVSPMFGANPLIGQAAVPVLLQHCRDHMLNYYRKQHKAATQAVELGTASMSAPVLGAQAQAQAYPLAEQQMSQQLGQSIMPMLEKVQALAAQYAPKPPVSPDAQLKAQTDTQMKQLELQSEAAKQDKELAFKAQGDQQRIAAEDRRAEQTTQLALLKLQSDDRLGALVANIDAMKTTLDVQTREMLARLQQAGDQQMELLRAYLKPAAAGLPPADLGAFAAQLAPLMSQLDQASSLVNTLQDEQMRASLMSTLASIQQLLASSGQPMQPSLSADPTLPLAELVPASLETPELPAAANIVPGVYP